MGCHQTKAEDGDLSTRYANGPIIFPEALKNYVEVAFERLQKGEGVIPCEMTGELHSNSLGNLRGFSSAASKRAWFDYHCQEMRRVHGDVLNRWPELNVDFVMAHASVAGAPLPPRQKLQESVRHRMEQQARIYEDKLSQIRNDLAAISAFDDLWPLRPVAEVKAMCIQPEDAFTFRLNYSMGVRRLEHLYDFTASLARVAGLNYPQAVEWSVKRPMRTHHKNMVHYPKAHNANDFRHAVDVYRTCILAENCGQLKVMVDILQCLGRDTHDRLAPMKKLGMGSSHEVFVVERIKNRFAQPAPGGYVDFLANIRINGYVCEVQLHLRAIQEVKKEEGRQLAKWFRHFVKDDVGLQSRAAGGKYEGAQVEGRPHGKGVFVYTSGDRYDGEWVDGTKHGAGTYFYHTGDKYVGEWQYDRMHGAGKFFHSSGETFEGEFVDGMRHGDGTHKSFDGEVTQATWWKNKRVEMLQV
mmetsp:Transcript_30857/g.89806  ORF Transcript_30857/g.89806 Transcript_30857/m.89806 type:complete len:469 (+) Transcript_30857:95-1501(+)